MSGNVRIIRILRVTRVIRVVRVVKIVRFIRALRSTAIKGWKGQENPNRRGGNQLGLLPETKNWPGPKKETIVFQSNHPFSGVNLQVSFREGIWSQVGGNIIIYTSPKAAATIRRPQAP